MTREDAISMLKRIADRRLMIHVNGTIMEAEPDEVNEALDMAISALERDRWISVDYSNPETLPQKEKSVLYCAFGTSVGEGYYRGFDGVHHVWKMYGCSGTHWDDEVTSWSELPQPPKEGTP